MEFEQVAMCPDHGLWSGLYEGWWYYHDGTGRTNIEPVICLRGSLFKNDKACRKELQFHIPYRLTVKLGGNGDWLMGLNIPPQEGRPAWYMVIRRYDTEEEANEVKTQILEDLKLGVDIRPKLREIQD